MLNTKRTIASIALAGFATAALGMSLVAGGTYDLSWHTIDGGGGTSTGGSFSLSGTIGQHDAGGSLTGGNFSLAGGFWAGAGGPTNQVATLLSFNIVFGSLVDGGLPQLLASDDQYLRIQSAFGFLSSEPNVVRVVIEADTDVGSPTQFDTTIESRTNNPNGTATIRARNWNTNAVNTIATYGIGTTDQFVVIQYTPSNPYIRNSDGRVQIEVKHVIVATFSTSGFQSRIDHFEIVVE
ncbi:MAG: hypothetical protein ACR2GY_13360 [Phycisphaerales bacterium]